MSKFLSPPETARLTELEAAIERGAETFIEVGTALMEIRDQRLYRQEHRNFESYVQERWGFKRDWAYKQIEAAQVSGNVLPVIQNGPSLSASNARSLSRLTPEEQRELAPVVAGMSKQEARRFVTEHKAKRGTLRIPSHRRHDELMRAVQHFVKVAERWQREMTDELAPPQAKKQLTVIEKAEEAIAEVKSAVAYRAATLHSYMGH